MRLCSAPGVPTLNEEQLDAMCPAAAAIAEVVMPNMRFFDVSAIGYVIIVIWLLLTSQC